MTPSRRVKAIHARARVLRWEYRQRNLAQGAWGRFRAALAHAERAFAIDEATAELLVAQGFSTDVGGRGLVPARTLVWITNERADALVDAREIALRLDADLLAAPCLALVPFRDDR
jgi:hypothetical protein